MGCADPFRRADRRTPSASSRFGSKLPLPLYADVRLHIPMTHHNNEGYFFNSDTVNFQAKYNCPIENMIVNGPNHPNTGYLGEASLDVEYISTVG